MTEGARYLKIVEWSDEDGCFVGRAPGFMRGGCDGDDERAVYAELCGIVEEIIEDYRKEGWELPPPTIGKIEYASFDEKTPAVAAA